MLRVSWIGSFQLFMQYAPGILVGRAFDSGYLYDLLCFGVLRIHSIPSHYMIAAGSFIQVVCTFMLSLSHHGQYYQVSFLRILNRSSLKPSIRYSFPKLWASGLVNLFYFFHLSASSGTILKDDEHLPLVLP